VSNYNVFSRPLFTWWVTLVQVLVCIVSLLFYGLGPVGWERVEMKGEVVDVSLVMRQVSYYEPVNHWIGPRFADLIRLGAKYSPCMRREPGLWRLIEEERRKENVTGCCVFNDRTGCYQTRQSSCPVGTVSIISYGIVCMRRKRGCCNLTKVRYNIHNPLAICTSVIRWPHGINGLNQPFLPSLDQNPTRHYWTPPEMLFTLTVVFRTPPHAVVVRPCLQFLAILGEQLGPYADKIRTTFSFPFTCHLRSNVVEIYLFSFCKRPSSVRPYEWPDDLTRWPVNCFSDICGMLPFLWRDYPDQFYRMFLSLFLHAGIIHCAFTVFVQMWLMLDLEMLIGWKRMAILYIGSGIGGNFASAIFVPYSPEVGPSGSHLGIMAALVVDLHHHRHIIVRPRRELMKHMLTVFVLFLTGLLPWIDNWAHLFGFLFGLLITIGNFRIYFLYS
ncbi:unnamed protein product, partial [Angiostrongylus costaricensis]|uniref:Rhomboid domain-containing protein n=1 Tax=Angiostrongylus costaricensis TaxID=334426 RepID=A0A0R3PSI6_ANGCS